MFTLIAALPPMRAQMQPFSGTPQIEQSLRKLNELGSVLMIAAHPDDERDGGCWRILRVGAICERHTFR